MANGNNGTPRGTPLRENASYDADIVKIGEMIAEISPFFDILKMAAVRRLGFARARICKTHDDNLVVFIVVQNLVGINADVLIL